MPFCSKCGTEVPEGVKFCSKCGNVAQATGELSLWEYYVKCLKNYVNFKDRARRKEYWGFFLFNFIIAVALGIVGNILGFIAGDDEGTLGTLLDSLYGFAVLLPSFGAVIRRLHDIGKSGWFWLFVFIPFVGWIIVLIWLCTDSQHGENQYGPNPKGV